MFELLEVSEKLSEVIIGFGLDPSHELLFSKIRLLFHVFEKIGLEKVILDPLGEGEFGLVTRSTQLAFSLYGCEVWWWEGKIFGKGKINWLTGVEG